MVGGIGTRATTWCLGIVMSLATAAAHAQTAPLPDAYEELAVDSGFVVNDGTERSAIFETVVQQPNAAWMRLEFASVDLGARPAGGAHTVIRVTSLLDGAVQHLNALHVGQWQETSAYFNGDAVRVEIVADPGAAPSRVRVIGAWYGDTAPGEIVDTLCGDDDRVPSGVQRVGRVMPVGCTAWIIDDANHCLLSAGHCVGGGFSVMQFRVPLSTSGGVYQAPPPSDQYAIDQTSRQNQNGAPTVGDDWAYFGCFANTETGLTPVQRQQSFFVLDHTPPLPSGQTIDVTGYGATDPPIPNEWNGAQKVHTGPYSSFNGTVARYAVDTTSGNSGSPVLNLDSGLAIAVHTNGGCGEFSGSNIGCALNNPSLLTALANPQGVCIPVQLLQFDYTNGIPSTIDPAGATMGVVVSGINGGTPEPGTAVLHVDTGSGFVDVPMASSSPNLYTATFPAVPCGTEVRFYVSAEDSFGQRFFDPSGAPLEWHDAVAAVSIDDVVVDDFESDLGWTVVDDLDLTDGSWDRGVPAGDGSRGDPTEDADGSGQCYLTDNVIGNSDVDGGSTTLVSPTLDASHVDSTIEYARWFSNTAGSNPEQDTMTIDVSDDDGATWHTLEIVGPGGAEVDGGWYHRQFRIEDLGMITNTAQFRIRFTASDALPGSVVEAAIDAVALRRVACEVACPAADLDDDCLVTFNDLVLLLGAWGPCPKEPTPCPADLDGNGAVDFNDLVQLLGSWT